MLTNAPGRFPHTRRFWILVALAIPAVLVWLSSPIEAAPTPRPTVQSDENSAEQGAQEPDGTARKSKRQAAKQERIDEYLRKKEEKSAEKERRKLEKALAEAEAAEGRTPMHADGVAETNATTGAEPAGDEVKAGDDNVEVQRGEPKAKTKRQRDEDPAEAERQMLLSRLPKRLARVQETVRGSRLGEDPTVVGYLDKIERQEASPQQLAAFGSFISQNGLVPEAQEYYLIAVNLDKKDAVLWLNLGILQRQTGQTQQAASSFARALSINPNNAAAHYNLGASMDEMRKYNEALEEYKIALRLDPSLGDPAVNPQAANNDRLMAVKLMLYKEQSGSASLPLADVPGGELDTRDRPQRP